MPFSDLSLNKDIPGMRNLWASKSRSCFPIEVRAVGLPTWAKWGWQISIAFQAVTKVPEAESSLGF
jgi:hypothetical protein